MCLVYLVLKKKSVSVVTVLSLLLSNQASCFIKQRVFASKGKKFGMVNVVLRASLIS